METVTTHAATQIALPVWGWEIVVYLFLGGLVAGLFVLGALLELTGGRSALSRGFSHLPLLALALLSAGMGALFFDLSHRLFVWRFYLAFRPTSPMSWGAWILVLIYPAELLIWLGGLERLPVRLAVLAPVAAWAREHRRGLLLTAVAMGAGLGIYTGLLLGTMASRPLWNSPVLGLLFLGSGISSGAALLVLLATEEGERKTLARWDLFAILGELVLIGLLVVGFATGGAATRPAADAFLGGAYTAVFWSLVVVTGLLVPFAMELLETRRRLAFTKVAPLLVLAGGLALRWVLLSAGQQVH